MKRYAGLCLLLWCSTQSAGCFGAGFAAGEEACFFGDCGFGGLGGFGFGFPSLIVASESVQVDTTSGPVDGGTSLHAGRFFLGIPYALAPLDGLRWGAPVPYSRPATYAKNGKNDKSDKNDKNDKSDKDKDDKNAKNQLDADEVLQATEYRPACAQRASPAYKSEGSESEDCLYLNIWTPEKPSSKKLPVMVWIHGGDHANGSSSERLPGGSRDALYDGSSLADKDVVVVTFNYRLGVFGFFPHPELQAEEGVYGNQGLLDQVAALKWIKQNIAAFGGDPKNVTLFGQGSGAQDVCYHMVSPLSRGLFHQAISESGGCTDYQAEPGDTQADFERWVSQVGCAGKNSLDCLRRLPVEKLLAAAPMARSPFRPIVDGMFLPDQPRTLFESGDVNRAAYILGSNSDEGSVFRATYSRVDNEAAYLAALQENLPASAVGQVGRAYSKAEYADNEQPYQAALSHALGDGRVVCPTWDTALNAHEAGLDVYTYSFDTAVKVEDTRAAHGAELGYVFGTGQALDGKQQKLSDLIQTYWTNFARYADPNDNNALEWPEYTDRKKASVNLSPTPSVASELRDRDCQLWREIYASQFHPPPAAAKPSR